jgi:exonuclease VII small subunit
MSPGNMSTPADEQMSSQSPEQSGQPAAAVIQPDTQRLDELVAQLERAAEQLRSGELSADAAATLVEDCASLATQASNELERLARAEVSPVAPGQESLL